jgi:hypothetical protein
VLDRKPDVLIEVEHFDAGPVNAGSGGEELEEIELRGAGGGDDARGFGLGQRGLERFGSVFGSGCS